ncbi:hypothetical protein EW026_g3519 [Hermanssonia centrifuga]|uniref:Arrestin-like N-terminal domain-containing protein n=1 Tax=Hermanssonia centrifuga TaxID=98765 RepID=A0A4S4KJW3_9APHY|nr:hypothetical protein EW026_g3519 [Hermanssonia centrifuga]
MHISYLYASKASNRGLEGCDPTIHTYELNDKHDKPWLILNIKSLNHSPSELPIIFGELPVTGSVALDLKEETQVKSISISLVGKMTTQDIIIYNFVHVSHELWSLEHKANNLTSEVPEDFNSKLSGTFSFPFSLELPKTLRLQNDGASECYQLPATFYTFLGRVVITYEIIVTVTTGGTLSAEHT